MRDDGGNDREVQARSTGAYSLVTSRPLGHDGDPGQPVTADHVAWLAARGLWANVAELVSLKSDDIGNRAALGAALRGAGPFPTPAAPQSLWHLVALLRVLGVRAEVRGAGRHVSLRLRPEADAEALAASCGPILKPETVHYRTERPTPGGLFSPQVFGDDALGERYRFGHLELARPIVPALWRAAPRPAVAEVLGVAPGEIERLVTGKRRLVRSEDGTLELADWDWESKAPAPLPAGTREVAAFADAVAELLRSLPGGAPLELCVEGFVRRIVLVPPPALRPVVKHGGEWVTSDTNELLRLLLNRSHRLGKLAELNAPEVVLLNERKMLQFYADALLAAGLADEPDDAGEADDADEDAADAPEARRLVDVLTQVLGTFTSAGTKYVDYSGRAAGVVDRGLPGDVAVVPPKIFDGLGLTPSAPVLLAHPGGGTGGAFAALYPRRGDDDERVRLPRHAFERLGLGGAGEGRWCAVHRPLGPAAVAEAVALVRGAPAPAPLPLGGRTDSDDRDVVHAGLLDAILDGHDLPLDSARGLLLGGTGATHWSDPAG